MKKHSDFTDREEMLLEAWDTRNQLHVEDAFAARVLGAVYEARPPLSETDPDPEVLIESREVEVDDEAISMTMAIDAADICPDVQSFEHGSGAIQARDEQSPAVPEQQWSAAAEEQEFPTLENDQEFPTLEEISTSSSLRKARIRAALFHKVEPVTVGRFVLLERLGAGGLGEIYAAYDAQLDRRVALKLLRHVSGSTARADDLLLREAQALAQVSHPNIVQIYEAGSHEGHLFIAMELIRGQTLTSWLEEASQLPRAHRQREVLRRFIAAGRGLEAAHAAGVAHRDFKPDNVLVGRDGRVCLVDFGLAQLLGDVVPPILMGPANDGGSCTSEFLAHSRLTVTGSVGGTPRFMAPEQFRGEAADHRSDQFSFCVALYRALYGVFPFAGEHPRELLASMEAGVARSEHMPSLAAPLREALCRGLSADPAKRFANMSELLAKLERSLRPSRRWIALTSSGSVAATAVLTILVGAVGKLTVSELMLSSLGLLTTLVGTAVGFYFGRITKPRD